MLKNFPWKTVLLTLFAWMLFWEVKETISGERRFFLVRWLYSDENYTQNIEVLSYILTDDQVSYMFAHPNEAIQQPTNRMLEDHSVNVVLRLKNRARRLTWGKLKWRMCKREWHIVDVADIPRENDKDKYAQIVIPIGNAIAHHNDELPDPVEVEWEQFYVYR